MRDSGQKKECGGGDSVTEAFVEDPAKQNIV